MILPELADDCWLFLWCTHNHKQDAHLVAKAWGFDRYRSEGIWVKLSRKGTVRIVGGHTLRQAHESFLLFSRGKPKRNDRGVPSVLMAEGFRKPDGRILHSGKPEEFYELVERFCSGPYAEMFARRPRDGWDSYGDELPKAAE